MSEPGQYTNGDGRIDPHLSEHEVIRTARVATELLHQLASQVRHISEPDVYDEAVGALAHFRDAQQRLEHQLRLLGPRIDIERGRRVA